MFFLISDSYASKGSHSFYWWRVPEVAEKLDLTSSQIDKIENIFQSHSMQIDNMDKELYKKEKEFKDILDSTIDSKDKDSEAKFLSKEILKLKSDRKALKLDMLFGIRDVLSVDQRKKLKKLRSKHK